MTVSLVVLAILVGCLTGPMASPAWAHNSLVSSSPADGARMDEAPNEVTLTFDEPVGRRFGVVVVTGPDGKPVQQGDLQVSGGTAKQRLAPLDRVGTYRVAWRVVSADGHPVSGELAFELRSGTSSPSPTATASAAATPPGTRDPSTPSASDRDDRRALGWPLVAGVTAIVFLATLGAGQIWRRRRMSSRAKEPADGH